MAATAQKASTREKILWRIVAAASAALAALAARQIVRLGWRATGHHEAGEDPDQPWTEAVAWAAAVGVGAGVARVLAVKGAARGWERVKGDPPPGADEHHSKKK